MEFQQPSFRDKKKATVTASVRIVANVVGSLEKGVVHISQSKGALIPLTLWQSANDMQVTEPTIESVS